MVRAPALLYPAAMAEAPSLQSTPCPRPRPRLGSSTMGIVFNRASVLLALLLAACGGDPHRTDGDAGTGGRGPGVPSREPRSDADCRAAAACRLEGRCKHRDGKCVAGWPADCQASDACAREGLCTWVSSAGHEDAQGVKVTFEYACVAARDTDCQGALACRDEGRCHAHRHRCATRCNADLCAHNGRCTAADGGDCIATSDADCQRSLGCRNNGQCKLVDQSCRPGSDDDCARSRACPEAGACIRDPVFNICKATQPEHCERSRVCREAGACKLTAHGGCDR
jgi:hypothetical protein